MGNFYTQVLVCNSTQEQCRDVMSDLGRISIITPNHRNIITVCDKNSENQDIDELDSVAYTLSHTLKTPTIAVLNHDDDFLLFRAFGPDGFKGYCQSGMLTKGAYKEITKAVAPNCGLFSIWFAFAKPYLFEVSRHQSLVTLLDLPPWSAGMGYNYLSQGDFDDEIPKEKLFIT